MRPAAWRGAALAVVAAVAGAGLVACSSTKASSALRPRRRLSALVEKVLPAPKGLLAASAPQPNGSVWVLSGTARVRAITNIDLSEGKVLAQVGVSNAASSLAESATGVVAVGLATKTAGAVELLNGTSGATVGSVAVGAPVRALAFGGDGVTLYVLNGNASSTSVTVVNTSADKAVENFGVTKDAIALAVDPDQSAVWVLARSGTVEEISLSSGKPVADFSLGNPGIAMAASPSGGTVYVLKGTAAQSSVAVVSTVTDSVVKVLPAAAGSVALAASPTGPVLYDFVGTSAVGNIQEISLSHGHV